MRDAHHVRFYQKTKNFLGPLSKCICTQQKTLFLEGLDDDHADDYIICGL